MNRRAPDSAIFAGAVLAGFAAAFLLSQGRHRTHRQNLFSKHPTRRFSALGWLEKASDPVALPMLRDYVAWEELPVLRGRARRLVHALEMSVR